MYYSLSHKTLNTRENFWNVYCFATNQMRDETAKDNGQTAAGIIHDLIGNNQLVLSSTRNLQFSLWISLKKPFLPQTLVTWFRLFKKKKKYRTDHANCENLQRYRFASWVKVSLLQKKRSKITNHNQVAWPLRETNTKEHCYWLAHFFLVLRRAV